MVVLHRVQILDKHQVNTFMNNSVAMLLKIEHMKGNQKFIAIMFSYVEINIDR